VISLPACPTSPATSRRPPGLDECSHVRADPAAAAILVPWYGLTRGFSPAAWVAFPVLAIANAWRSRRAITGCGRIAPTRRTGVCGCCTWCSAHGAAEQRLRLVQRPPRPPSIRRRRGPRSVLGAARVLVLAHRLDAARVPERQARLLQHPGLRRDPMLAFQHATTCRSRWRPTSACRWLWNPVPRRCGAC